MHWCSFLQSAEVQNGFCFVAEAVEEASVRMNAHRHAVYGHANIYSLSQQVDEHINLFRRTYMLFLQQIEMWGRK